MSDSVFITVLGTNFSESFKVSGHDNNNNDNNSSNYNENRAHVRYPE
ncbi:hypothetical protein VTH82DRAFT_1796 [Thermothelomyces myriococcoides]